MAEFIAVVNDTDPKNGGKSYALKIPETTTPDARERIGDVVDGLFVGEGDKTLSGYKLEITGGSDKTGTPCAETSRAATASPFSSPIHRIQG